MSVPVALDTTILSDIAAARIPKSKIEDRKAIDALVDLAREGKVELGIALTGAMIEFHKVGGRKRQVLADRVCGLLRKWPVEVADQAAIERKKTCLKEIMQDRDGSDSEIFLVSTLHSQYFLTTDYKYRQRFRQQESRIRERCAITDQVLTPSEFLEMYASGKICP